MEIRLQSKGDGKLRWMLGGYWEDVFDTWFYFTDVQDLANTDAWTFAQAYAFYYKYTSGYDNLQYPLPATTYGYVQTMFRTNEQIAIFGEVEYDISDELTVIAVQMQPIENIHHPATGSPGPRVGTGGQGQRVFPPRGRELRRPPTRAPPATLSLFAGKGAR